MNNEQLRYCTQRHSPCVQVLELFETFKARSPIECQMINETLKNPTAQHVKQ